MAALAAPAALCPRCCQVIEEGARDGDGCETCGHPFNVPIIFVASNARMALAQKLFKRLTTPRACEFTARCPNVCQEQFPDWIRDSWKHKSSTYTLKEDREVYTILEWEDIKALCRFEQVSLGTNFIDQGVGNARCSIRGNIGIIAPPLTLTHTVKRTVEGRGSERRAVEGTEVHSLSVIYHVGVVHEYADEVQMSALYPDSNHDHAYPALASNYITERFRQDLVAGGPLRGQNSQPTIDAVRQWDAHPDHV